MRGARTLSGALARTALAGLLLWSVAGCSPGEQILEGERLGVREALLAGPDGTVPTAETASETSRTVPLRLPAALAADWPQAGRNAAHAGGHMQLAASPAEVWRASIGDGESRRLRITAAPVMAEGRVFTLDASTQLAAFSPEGARLWQRDLTPPWGRRGATSGGGLAVGVGLVLAGTGFGSLTALDPATGEPRWTQRLDAALSGPPAIEGGIVYAVTRDSTALALRASDGRVLWQVEGVPDPAGLAGGPAPAIGPRQAYFPFSSSEIVATLRRGGLRVWNAPIPGQRRGEVYARLTDIVASPALVEGVLYVGNQSGRMVALAANSGARLWTAEEGAMGTPVVAGGSVFVVSDAARLVRLDARTGATLWASDLPRFPSAKPRRRDEAFAHYGPVLAGGRLWVASSDGLIRGFNPESGALEASLDLPGGAASAPIAAQGTLYAVSRRGQLHAFR